MTEKKWLADEFEANRDHLRAVAYRMLGSASEADDAVQESWLRLSGADTGSISNLTGWLTTVIARVCLDMLRSRKTRREDPLEVDDSEPAAGTQTSADPERDAILADSVGLAMLVVLQELAPAERVAFVLHDMFDLPFEDIAPIVGRSPAATRQLASRARRRVAGGNAEITAPDRARHQQVLSAFLTASRDGDLSTLLALLDPDVVFRGDAAAVRMGGPKEVRGADAVAKTFLGRAQVARPALIDGAPGVAVAPNGQLKLVLEITLKDNRIAEIRAVADPERLRNLDLVIDD